MSTINAIVEPSFGMPVVAAPCAAGRQTDALTTAIADAARHTYALSTGVVADGGKRRFGKGSPAWRSPDC